MISVFTFSKTHGKRYEDIIHFTNFSEAKVILEFTIECPMLYLILEQANKEKISYGRVEVHEIAAFVLNASGHYEAINRNCSNYYLSAESVALFTDHLSSRPNYIVGQIVQIVHCWALAFVLIILYFRLIPIIVKHLVVKKF